MTRLLLPFTFGVEMDVLDALVRIVSHQCATLIPLSLISLPVTKRKGVRLELLQQSKDFLEAIHYKAARYQVPVEAVEVFTRDIEQSILTCADQLHCGGILLVTREARGSLLKREIIQHLLHIYPCTLFVVSFPVKKRRNRVARAREDITRWWSGAQSNHETRLNAASEVHTARHLLASMPSSGQAEQREQTELCEATRLIAYECIAVRRGKRKQI